MTLAYRSVPLSEILAHPTQSFLAKDYVHNTPPVAEVEFEEDDDVEADDDGLEPEYEDEDYDSDDDFGYDDYEDDDA